MARIGQGDRGRTGARDIVVKRTAPSGLSPALTGAHRFVSSVSVLAAVVIAVCPYAALARGTSELEIVHPTLDVCELLSERTAAALLGVAGVASQASDPAVECSWVPVGTPGSVPAQAISISIEWLGPTDVAHLAQEPGFGVTSAAAQRVTDLPAKAIWIDTKRTLVVLSTGMRMEVSMTGPWSPDVPSDVLRTRAVRAAREVLLNLPP
jgi:hypothetical protein